MKACSKCGKITPLDGFHRRAESPDGRSSTCKVCAATTYAAKLERRKQRMAADPAYAARVREWGRDYRRRMRDVRYGVATGTVDALMVAQDGRCAACRLTADEVACTGKSGEQLHVDHDHRTGRVRGLLCKKCNSVLGLVDDDPGRLQGLIAYLLTSMREAV